MYNPTIPQDNPPPVIATAAIKANFKAYNTIFANNHVAMNDSNQGKHTNVIFQQQTQDPEATNFDAIYCKANPSSSGTNLQMFLRVPAFLPNSQANLPQQWTFNKVNTAGPQFQSFLPGGFVMYFGNITSVPTTITLSPTPSQIVCAIANANAFANGGTGAPLDVETQVLTASTFKITSQSTGPYNISWIAIAIN